MQLAAAASLLLAPAVLDAAAAASDCTNYGVVLSLLGSFRCGDGACSNRGLVVWAASDTCFGDGAANACLANACILRAPEPAA